MFSAAQRDTWHMKRSTKKNQYRVEMKLAAGGAFVTHYASEDRQMAEAIGRDLKRLGQTARLVSPTGEILEAWEGK